MPTLPSPARPPAPARRPDLVAWAAELKAGGYSARTIRLRVQVVDVVARAAGCAPCDLTRPDVVAYLGARDYSAETRRAYLQHLHRWGQWAGIEGLVEGIRKPPAPRRVPRPITEAQLSRLLLAARVGHPERAWVLLGAYAGLRSAESAGVRAEHLVETADGPALFVEGKGGKRALIPLPALVVDALRPWVQSVGGQGRLWPTATPPAVQAALRRLGERAGARFTSHQLRHRYGTAMYQATGRDLLATQQAMRHSSPTTTAGYALVAGDAVRAAVNHLPGLAQ